MFCSQYLKSASSLGLRWFAFGSSPAWRKPAQRSQTTPSETIILVRMAASPKTQENSHQPGAPAAGIPSLALRAGGTYSLANHGNHDRAIARSCIALQQKDLLPGAQQQASVRDRDG